MIKTMKGKRYTRKEKLERNQRLYKSWKGGMLGNALAGRYHISESAVCRIIQRMKVKEAQGDNN